MFDTDLFNENVTINQLRIFNANGEFTLEGFNGKYLYIETTKNRLAENLVRAAHNLERITIVSPPIVEVGWNAFTHCDSLREIVVDFAPSVTIHPSFIANDGLIITGKKPKKIISDVQAPDSFFSSAAFNAETIELSSSRLDGPFSSFSRLRNLILSGEDIEISTSAFENMKLESVKVAGKLIAIGNRSFSNNSKLRIFDPGFLSDFSVGDSAFEGDSQLDIGLLLQRTSSIGERAIIGCNIPETFRIPIDLAEKIKEMFGNITGRKIVYILNDGQLKQGNFTSITNAIVRGRLNKSSKARRYKQLVNVTIEENDEYIPKSFFKNLRNLETVVVNESVKVIGEKAFQGCKNLKKVILPSTLSSIKDNAFSHCPKDLLVELENHNQLDKLLQDNPKCFLRSRIFKKKSPIQFCFRKGE